MNFLPPASKYPKKIHIKNETYRVVFTKKFRHYGETDPVKKTIHIRAGMSRRETFKTFIHELLHAIEFECDFKYDLRHSQIYDLENAIFEMLVDNFLGQRYE